jgi:peptidoglycan/LPS O-acetylase OafA/YrhL
MAGQQRTVPKWIGLLIAFEAATFAIAAFLHLDRHVVFGTWEPQAAVPEAIIGLALAFGSFEILKARPQARRTAKATTGFAISGVLLGISVTAGGGDAANLIYHACILVVLVSSVLMLRGIPRYAEASASEAHLTRGKRFSPAGSRSRAR